MMSAQLQAPHKRNKSAMREHLNQLQELRNHLTKINSPRGQCTITFAFCMALHWLLPLTWVFGFLPLAPKVSDRSDMSRALVHDHRLVRLRLLRDGAVVLRQVPASEGDPEPQNRFAPRLGVSNLGFPKGHPQKIGLPEKFPWKTTTKWGSLKRHTQCILIQTRKGSHCKPSG